MSSAAVNDENRGVSPGGKNSSSQKSNDIFDLDQPTGRPSILRQSQAENRHNTGVKVCFQTPRRDPVTKRILSPSKPAQMTSLDEFCSALGSLKLETPMKVPTSAVDIIHEPKPEVISSSTSYPDDEMPIKSTGGYLLDFDNLDAINPFEGSCKMRNVTPDSPAGQSAPQASTSPPSEDMLKEPKTGTALDDTLPFHPSVENSLLDGSIDIPSTDSSVVTVQKNPATELLESPAVTAEEPSAATLLSFDKDKSAGTACLEDAPLPAQGQYALDFDNLDLVNPFQTGGSKIPNSPVVRAKLPCGDQVAEVSGMKELAAVSVDMAEPELSAEVAAQPAAEPGAPVAPSDAIESAPGESGDTVQPAVAESVKTLEPATAKFGDAVEPVAAESDSQPAAGSPKGPVMLQFNFDDDKEVKCKPPPKKFGNRKSTTKASPEGKDGAPSSASPVTPVVSQDSEVPPAKGSYTFDYEKLANPSFNPFGTSTGIKNSPKSGFKSSPTEEAIHVTEEEAASQLVPTPAELAASHTESSSAVAAKADEIDSAISLKMSEDQQPEADLASELKPEPPVPSTTQSAKHNLPSEPSEKFISGALFMSTDFDGQIDYLEQFGSSNFKDSALRKQSLYLKFDPLLKESPKKSAGPTAQIPLPCPVKSLGSCLEGVQAVPSSSKKEASNLVDAPAVVPLVQTPPILENLVPPFLNPPSAEEAIIDVLKYSQKDMDAAIAKVHAEAKEKEEEWKVINNNLLQDKMELGKILSSSKKDKELLKAEQQKEKTLAEAKCLKLQQENEEISRDLCSMERSCSDLIRRLDTYKEVIANFKKNEETLKQCAEEYLAQIKKDEERYQALKTQAEKKLAAACEGIAELKSKLKSESAAFQVQQRRAQLKIQSLEKNLDQKVKENEELTKLCDELIANSQK